MKQTVKSTIAVASGVFVASVMGMVLRSQLSPELVYTNGELPAFAETQDYTSNIRPPLVRLEDSDGKFFCSGTVISDDYVLTAAHCLVKSGFFPGIRKDKIYIISPETRDHLKSAVVAEAAAINTRADYGLIKGDFKVFTKAKILTSPNTPMILTGPLLTCGFPWGTTAICYPTGNRLTPAFEFFSMHGLMYPGMSGGPAVDGTLHAVFAVNSSIGDSGIIYVAPLIGLFETLGVRVIK